MSESAELLELAKCIVGEAANDFLSRDRGYLSQVSGSELGGREVKLVADAALESSLLDRLLPTGVTVLSEETGLIRQGADNTLRWIIDPLDGSVNYLRGIGPSALSVALWRDDTPLFGVLFRLDERSLAWGGNEMGAWIDDRPIHVSSKSRIDQAMLCTGIPARFPIHDAAAVSDYFLKIAKFAKVRMLGSAACSLLMVARGAADAYFEDQIMLWDVAAGLAIVEGAGGNCWVRARETEFGRSVVAAAPAMHPDLRQNGFV